MNYTYQVLETNKLMYGIDIHTTPCNKSIYAKDPGMIMQGDKLKLQAVFHTAYFAYPELLSIYDLHTIRYEYYVCG